MEEGFCAGQISRGMLTSKWPISLSIVILSFDFIAIGDGFIVGVALFRNKHHLNSKYKTLYWLLKMYLNEWLAAERVLKCYLQSVLFLDDKKGGFNWFFCRLVLSHNGKGGHSCTSSVNKVFSILTASPSSPKKHVN
jgi:hypothetical protein